MPNFRSLASPNWNFDRLFLLKAYKILAKKVQRNYFSWHWKGMQNLKKTWFVVSKMTNIWWILIWALKSLENMHFDWSQLVQSYNVWPKKVRRSYLSWKTERLTDLKSWKTDLWYGKCYEKFGKFSPELLKVLKLLLLWDSFFQSRK